MLPFTVITTASSHGLFDGRGGGVWALEGLAGARGRPIDHGRRAARIVRAAGNEDMNAPPFVVPRDCFRTKRIHRN